MKVFLLTTLHDLRTRWRHLGGTVTTHESFSLLFDYVNIWTFLGCSIFEQATEHQKKKKRIFSKKKKKIVKAGFFVESSCNKDLGGVWTFFWALTVWQALKKVWRTKQVAEYAEVWLQECLNRGVQTKPIQQNLYSDLQKNTREITNKSPTVKATKSNFHS